MMLRPGRSAVLNRAALLAFVATSVAAHAQFQNPIQAAKDAYKKARAQQQQQQQTAGQTSGGQSQTATQAAAPGGGSGSSDSAAPWVPPSADGPVAAAQASVKLDPAKMPDIVGVHLGMTAQEALAAARKAFPNDMYQNIPVGFWPTAVKPDYGVNVLSRAPGNFKDLTLSFTAPPGKQIVWRIGRQAQKIHTNRNTLITALREKYGKESYAWRNADMGTRVTNDAEMTGMLWLYDEQGSRVPMPNSTVFARRNSFEECVTENAGDEPRMPKDEDWVRRFTPWCQTHYVALTVQFGPTEIIENTLTMLEDVPLSIRTARAADTWMRELANRQHQQDVDRSKETRPTL